MRADVFGGYWRDTGRFDDALECNRVLLEATEPGCAGEIDERSQLVGPVTVEAGARVVRSRIVGPAVIGAGTTVVDSYVGPFTAVAANCVSGNVRCGEAPGRSTPRPGRKARAAPYL